ncbi:MAG: phosphoglycerate kinase, partial [Pseudomonadota bacterium]|nr:phosphoglycerate kinase [Pseudomonadota bacterium]
ANTFLAAQGRQVGESLIEPDLLGTAAGILEKAAGIGREIVLPIDVVLAKEFKANAASRAAPASDVGDGEMILDIGPKSADYVISCLRRCRTLVWNGPFGAFELKPFDAGTNAVARAAAKLTKEGRLLTIAGGGDTVAALNAAGVTGDFSYVSTAGGAFLEWMEGKVLPGLEVLRKS